MEKDDGVAGFQEIFGGGSATGTGGEVVDESDGLVFERDGGSAGCYEHHSSIRLVVVGDECFGELDMIV